MLFRPHPLRYRKLFARISKVSYNCDQKFKDENDFR